MFVFVSDVHLSKSAHKRYQVFKSWLLSLCSNDEVTKVFLVGDVFDLWLGDKKHFKDQYNDVLEIIFKLAKDKEVHIFEGNHDFQMGKYWLNEGVHIHKSYYSFTHEEKKWLITHGDLIDQSDKGYLFLRSFFRSFFARFLIFALPGFLLSKIGNFISKTEKKGAPTLEQRELFDKNWLKWSKALKEKRDFDYFICGHYHFRADLKTESYRALNLGSWLGSDYKVLSFSENSFEFKKI